MMHEYVGTQQQITATLSHLSALGQAEYFTPPVRRPDGQFVVRVQLRGAGRSLMGRDRSTLPSGRVVLAAVVAGLVALAGLITGAWLLWLWAVAHWAQIVAAIAGLILLFTILGKLGACPGIHCFGCKHR